MKLALQIFNYTLVKNESTDTVDIFMDGDIVDEPTREILADWWGDTTSVSFKSIRNQILNCGTKNIAITINSGGGHVGDAMAMHDFIEDCNTNKGYNISTKTIGMAASAATYPAMAGKDKSSITKNSFFMIHNVSGAIWGDVNAIENYAKTLRKFNDVITNFYATATGLPVATITEWMNEEKWMDGEEAVQHGFIKECTGSTNFKNSLKPEQFPFANKAILNKYNSYATNKDKGMKKNKIANAIAEAFKKLGIGNDASLKDVKVNDLKTAIIDALGTQEDDDIDQDTITNFVENAMKGDAITTMVNSAVTKALETVPSVITNAINTATTTATQNLLTVDAFNTFKDDLAEKLVVPNNRRGKEDEGEDKGKYNHKGIGWQKDEE